MASLVVVVGLRALLSLRGYLYMDDFAFRYWAATSPLDLDYLLRSYGGHVNPVGLLIQWVAQHTAPGSYLVLAISSLVMYAAALSLFAGILWRLTRRPAAIVLGVTLAGVSLFGFEVTVWWAGAIYAGPYQVFLLACLLAAMKGVAGGSRAWSIAALVFGAGMVLSFSRGSAGLVLVWLLVASLPLHDGKPLGVRGCIQRAPRLWAGLLTVAVAGGLLVLANAGRIDRPGLSLATALRYMWDLLVLNILPAIWGGPWRWFELPNQQWPPILANPAPMWWAVWLAGFVSVLAAVGLWIRRPALRQLLLALLAYTGIVLMLAAYARAGSVVASVAYRYTFDLVWPVALLATLAVVPVFGEVRRVSRPGFAVLCGIIALAMWSTLVPARDWAGNPTKQYMANAATGFGLITDGRVLDQGVPFDLIHPVLMAPYANARTVMTPQPGAPEFVGYAEQTMYGFAPDGRVEEQDVEGPASLTGPDADCGYRITDIPRTIPLDGRLIAWGFYARVAYFSGTDTTLNLAVGGQIHTVPLRAEGLRAVYFPVSGPGEEVLVSVGTPGVVACITDLRIGNRISAQTGEQVPTPITELIR
ncbi:MAG: hypothetical protein IPG68_10785 [Micrococcales bacterium]|nr:hypothetical protein [Micrococcales bacterium]